MHITVLSGAGISAESGIKTFRDHNGLWEGHDVNSVATPEGFAANPSLVHQFYNARRAQLKKVQPNRAHKLIAGWDNKHDVTVITQNVDDLHERAGSKSVIHLHGELLKSRSTGTSKTYSCTEDLSIHSICPSGFSLRPDIVWFGEAVPLLDPAAEIVAQSDLIIIVGTSMQVYPAASLYQFARAHTPVYYIDPAPAEVPQKVKVLTRSATEGIEIMNKIIEEFRDS